jgi:hypothetical protein
MLKFIQTFLLILFLFKNVKSTCLFDWDNTCRTNVDCCSNFCDNNNGQWAHGICKPKQQFSKSIKLETTTTITTQPACHLDWYDKCTKNSDCCSSICENNNGKWKNGVCKPKATTRKTHTTFKINLSCRKDWYDKCHRDSECCSQICDKHNNNQWDFGVCLPKSTTPVFKPIKVQTKTTNKKQLITSATVITNRQEKLLPKCECVCGPASFGICKP